MKAKNLLFVLIVMASAVTYSQESSEKPSGKVVGKVYFNYHADFTKGAEQFGAFELTRAYFGYQHNFNKKVSAKILLDAGKNSGGSSYTLFIKNAKLDYKANDWLKLTAGIFGMKQFKVQEDFWGYRYLYKSLEDEYKFGSSADVGVMASFKLHKKLHLDVLAVNGDGYRNLQDDSGKNRYGINLIYYPIESLTLKAYYDTMKGDDIEDPDQITTVGNIALFAGYKFTDRFKIGAEYNFMQNGVEFNKPSQDKDLKGYSFYSTYFINRKWNVFGRYDVVTSNKLPNETLGWNYEEDLKATIIGFEYKPIKGVNTSVNYRYLNYEDETINNGSFVYLNLEFYF